MWVILHNLALMDLYHTSILSFEIYPLRASSSMPRNLSCDENIIGSRALHFGMWYGHSKSWIVEMGKRTNTYNSRIKYYKSTEGVTPTTEPLMPIKP